MVNNPADSDSDDGLVEIEEAEWEAAAANNPRYHAPGGAPQHLNYGPGHWNPDARELKRLFIISEERRLGMLIPPQYCPRKEFKARMDYLDALRRDDIGYVVLPEHPCGRCVHDKIMTCYLITKGSKQMCDRCFKSNMCCSFVTPTNKQKAKVERERARMARRVGREDLAVASEALAEHFESLPPNDRG